MELKNKLNGGTVTVSEEYAARLLATGEFEKVQERKRATKAAKQEDPKED